MPVKVHMIGKVSSSLGFFFFFLEGDARDISAPATWELEEASWVLGGRGERATGWMAAGVNEVRLSASQSDTHSPWPWPDTAAIGGAYPQKTQEPPGELIPQKTH